MTALRQSAIMELEKLPEDKLGFIIQIMQGVNGLYTDTDSERKEAFARLEQLRRKGTVTDDDAELASYRELRKDYNAKERREVLSNLCKIFDVEGIDKAKLISGLQNENFSDFEDCLQMECAKSYAADYIVTRNVSDYATSEIKVILPKEYNEL